MKCEVGLESLLGDPTCKENKMTPDLPIVYYADDYHEFKNVKIILKRFGINVEYKEVGMEGRQYVAVFYSEMNSETENLIRSWETIPIG